MSTRLALLALLFAAPPVAAQSIPGSCKRGRAERTIEAGLVRSAVFNTGSLFFGGSFTNGDGYLVPRGNRLSPLFAANLWIGGIVGGEIRTAAASYGTFEFWPGPIGADGLPADCAGNDRIFVVRKQDVAAYLGGAPPTPDLRDWPAALGAPVLDGDGIKDNYNLAGGDQPALRGDVVAWWVMNDVGPGGLHPLTQTLPLGVEARVESFGFDDGPLNATTFYRYTVTNRTAQPIEALYAGLFTDTDLGDASDDYVGTDTLSQMGYTYNDSNFDANYGAAPPALGVVVARGPVGLANGRDDDRDGSIDEPGERIGLTATGYFINGTPSTTTDIPARGAGVYWRLQGLWSDGTPIRTYGNGYAQTQGAATTFAFAGDPVARQVWSEVNNGMATYPANPGGNRSFVSASGPFRIGPGQSETITFAIPYARGASNLDSITRLRGLAVGLRSLFVDGDLEAQRVLPGAPPVPPAQDVRFGLPSPNPFTGRAAVRFEMPVGTPLRATLHDALGRRVAVLFDGNAEAPTGEIAVDGAALAPGVYRMLIRVPGGERVLTLTKSR